MEIGDRVRVDCPTSAWHGAIGEVGEIHGDEAHIRLDEVFLHLLPTPETENMIPFLNSELELLDGTTPEYPAECWIVVDSENLFVRRKLPDKPCCVQVFSSEQLAGAYAGKARIEFEDDTLAPRRYTWDGIIERFGEDWMHYALLDHEHGSDEGVIIPIPRKRVVDT